MLELLIFILDRAFEPVFRIQIHDDAALIKAVSALGKIGFYDEREKLFLRFHLKHRCVIVAEMIIGPLPESG